MLRRSSTYDIAETISEMPHNAIPQAQPTVVPEPDLHPKTPKKPQWSAYFKAGLISILYALGALALLAIFGEAGNMIFSSWYQTAITFAAFVGSHLSGATYFGRIKDLWSDVKTKWSRELKGTALGITIALVVGITFTILRTAGHFFVGGAAEIVVNFIAAIGAVVGTVGSMAGFANRLSNGRDVKAIFTGLALGLGTSLALFFTGNAALTTVAAVTSFLTGGIAIPFWVIGTLFVVGYTGANVSSFDYHAKAFRYVVHLKNKFFNPDYQPDEALLRDFHQFRGSAVGVIAGLVMASIVIVSVGIFVTQPWFLAIPIGLGVYYSCTSLIGGLCGRIGRKIGEFLANMKMAETPPVTQPISSPSPQLTTKLNVEHAAALESAFHAPSTVVEPTSVSITSGVEPGTTSISRSRSSSTTMITMLSERSTSDPTPPDSPESEISDIAQALAPEASDDSPSREDNSLSELLENSLFTNRGESTVTDIEERPGLEPLTV